MRILVLKIIILFCHFLNGQEEPIDNVKALISIRLYTDEANEKISIAWDYPEDSLYMNVNYDSVPFRIDITQPLKASKYRETIKLFKFLKRRRKLTFLFNSKGKVLHWDYHLAYPPKESNNPPDSVYFYTVINSNLKTRYVQLINNNYNKSKCRYIFLNWPWQIIPSWRLYNKTIKASKEINSILDDNKNDLDSILKDESK